MSTIAMCITSCFHPVFQSFVRLSKSLSLLFVVYVSNTDCNAIYHVDIMI